MSLRDSPIAGALFIAAGLWMLLFQHHFQAWQQRRHQERLADRHARGKDAYFEELREIEAYPPETVSSPMQRVLGALLIILGASQLAIIYAR